MTSRQLVTHLFGCVYWMLAMAVVGSVTAGTAVEPLSLRETIGLSAFHDARSGPVRILGMISDTRPTHVLVRVTTSLGSSLTARVSPVAGKFVCRYPDDFVGAGQLAPGMVFIDATT